MDRSLLKGVVIAGITPLHSMLFILMKVPSVEMVGLRLRTNCPRAQETEVAEWIVSPSRTAAGQWVHKCGPGMVPCHSEHAASRPEKTASPRVPRTLHPRNGR